MVVYLNKISIHTALAGCDHQPRCVCLTDLISIHTALAGCDNQYPHTKGPGFPISIHTALAGCDTLQEEQRMAFDISIHTALAGCDKINTPLARTIQISIHTALAGCDVSAAGYRLRNAYFNPHSPRWL